VDAGLHYGKNDPTIGAGNRFIQGTLESQDFSGRNRILDDLSRTLGSASFETPTHLLLDFLGSGNSTSLSAPGVAPRAAPGSAPGSRQGSALPSPSAPGGANRAAAGLYMTPRSYPAPAPRPGTPGPVPDTGRDSSFFAEQIRALFDPSRLDPANDPTLQPYIEALRREALEGHREALADLNARAEGTGRFGGGLYQNLRTRAGEEFDEALASEIASVYLGARENALGRQMQGLGLLNARDLAAMQDATDRYGIDQQAASARAAAASAAAAQQAGLDLQRELGLRSQDLEAIQSLMGHQQYGLSTLAGLGQQHTQDQFTALGAIPALQNIGLQGLDVALGGAQGLVNLDQLAQQDAASRRAASAQNAALNFERSRWNEQRAQRELDSYLRTIGVIAGLGGQAVNPGTYLPAPSTSAATLQGLLGGASTGLGIYGSAQAAFGAGGG